MFLAYTDLFSLVQFLSCLLILVVTVVSNYLSLGSCHLPSLLNTPVMFSPSSVIVCVCVSQAVTVYHLSVD